MDNNNENLYADQIKICFLGLAPEGNFKQAQADMLAQVIGELENKLSAAMVEKDPEKKVTASCIEVGFICSTPNKTRE